LYGGTPVVELCELPLFTLEERGLRPSFEIPDGGVRTLLTGWFGWVVLVGGKVGNLCMPERSGGGSWKFGRFEAADLRAVKLCGFSIVGEILSFC
jgi:hypothetical protein